MSNFTTTALQPDARADRAAPRHSKLGAPMRARISAWLRRTLWPASSIDRVLTVGRALIVCQLAWLMAFSTVQWQRGALTRDFSIYNQARWLLAHGNFNPFSTPMGIPYWQNHGEALMWVLAQVTRLPPHSLWLLYTQDFSIAGAGWVLASWARAIAHSTQWASALASICLSLAIALLLLNPWVYFAAAWDFHMEPIGVLFAALCAYSLYRGRIKHAWVWALFALSAGDVVCLFVIGASLGAVLAGKQRKWAAWIGACALLWLVVLTLAHANKGSGLQGGFAYLAGPISSLHAPSIEQIAVGALTHPARTLSNLWAKRLDIWANIAPSGVLGALTPWGLPMVLLDTGPSLLYKGNLFAAPGYQNIATYFFV